MNRHSHFPRKTLPNVGGEGVKLFTDLQGSGEHPRSIFCHICQKAAKYPKSCPKGDASAGQHGDLRNKLVNASRNHPPHVRQSLALDMMENQFRSYVPRSGRGPDHRPQVFNVFTKGVRQKPERSGVQPESFLVFFQYVHHEGEVSIGG
ncbi:hypothetical protein GDO81_027676 [Engystomops pustulosus]|uniref:Uncharacterized protein n=1 Tax=Engystomops pustulosus TaxID=76066 RepID=A0AAV6YFK9_ENGPU|nr:hypothetical protein GDO81_027676 [Engystomops pustulosus]